MDTTVKKACSVCGIDLSGMKRVRDSQNHYFCEPCYAEAINRHKAATNQRPSDQHNAAPVRECANCGRRLGKLEKLFSWHGSEVCAACHGILRAEAKAQEAVTSANVEPSGMAPKQVASTSGQATGAFPSPETAEQTVRSRDQSESGALNESSVQHDLADSTGIARRIEVVPNTNQLLIPFNLAESSSRIEECFRSLGTVKTISSDRSKLSGGIKHGFNTRTLNVDLIQEGASTTRASTYTFGVPDATHRAAYRMFVATLLGHSDLGLFKLKHVFRRSDKIALVIAIGLVAALALVLIGGNIYRFTTSSSGPEASPNSTPSTPTRPEAGFMERHYVLTELTVGVPFLLCALAFCAAGGVSSTRTTHYFGTFGRYLGHSTQRETYVDPSKAWSWQMTKTVFCVEAVIYLLLRFAFPDFFTTLYSFVGGFIDTTVHLVTG